MCHEFVFVLFLFVGGAGEKSYTATTPTDLAMSRSPFATACISGVHPALFLADSFAPPSCARYLWGGAKQNYKKLVLIPNNKTNSVQPIISGAGARARRGQGSSC